MISAFGVVMRKIRSTTGDSLRTCATKLDITARFLSSMEVVENQFQHSILKKIKNLYGLDEQGYMELYNAMIETNKHVDIEIEKMNETQKEVFMVFASRIENADFELLEKFKKSISRTL
jgi:hypothetical protein